MVDKQRIKAPSQSLKQNAIIRENTSFRAFPRLWGSGGLSNWRSPSLLKVRAQPLCLEHQQPSALGFHQQMCRLRGDSFIPPLATRLKSSCGWIITAGGPLAPGAQAARSPVPEGSACDWSAQSTLLLGGGSGANTGTGSPSLLGQGVPCRGWGAARPGQAAAHKGGLHGRPPSYALEGSALLCEAASCDCTLINKINHFCA